MTDLQISGHLRLHKVSGEIVNSYNCARIGGVTEQGILEYGWRRKQRRDSRERLELNALKAPSRGLHQTAPSGGGS